MKKLGKTILSGIILSSGLLFGTSDAFAMGSKGQINFRTDANVYSKSATSIDVTGYVPYPNSVVELYGKDNGEYERIELYRAGNFSVHFNTRGLKSGLYDVKVASDTGGVHLTGELTNYLRVNMK
ncbi:hypothetical protein [Bacillus sp. C1]